MKFIKVIYNYYIITKYCNFCIRIGIQQVMFQLEASCRNANIIIGIKVTSKLSLTKPTISLSKRFICCIYKSSLVVIWLPTFQKIIPILTFPTKLALRWPLTLVSELWLCCHMKEPLWFQLDLTFLVKTQTMKTDTFHLTWPHMTLDLETIFHLWPKFVVIRLFKGKVKNKNLTKLEHILTLTHPHTHTNTPQMTIA